MKKILSLLLALSLLLCAVPLTASAVEKVSEGDFDAIVLDDGTVRTSDYHGNASYVKLPQKIAGYTVSMLGSGTFSDSYSVVGVELPYTVTTAAAFSLSTNTQTLVVTDNLKNASGVNMVRYERGDGTFFRGGLSNLTIYAFAGSCENAEAICEQIKNDDYSVALAKFDYTEPMSDKFRIVSFTNYGSKVHYVNIPTSIHDSDVTELGEKLFFDYYNGYEINEVVLPERLEILHDYALAGNQLESVKLPKTLKTIGEYALAWNSHMSTIDIPFDAEIKENAFAFISPLTLRGYYNTGAEQFCKTYGGYTFEPLSDFEMAHTDGGFAVTGYRSTNTALTIPERFLDEPVVEIGDAAFFQSDIRSAFIPASIRRIGALAFGACEKLEALYSSTTEPKMALLDVEEIGNNAFVSCTSLKNTELELNADAVGEDAFFNTPLQSVTLYTHGAEIGKDAFGYIDNHEETGTAKTPDFTVRGWYQSTANVYANDNEMRFEQLDDLAYDYEVLPDDTLKITRYRLYQNDVMVPDTLDGKTVTVIGSEAFLDNRMKSVALPICVTKIEPNAFDNCKRLEKVSFWNGDEGTSQLREIGDRAFYRCTSLMRFPFIDTSLERIGNEAFSGCENFRTSLHYIAALPPSLAHVGSYAFYNTKIPYVTFFNEEVEIGDYAFGYVTDTNTGEPEKFDTSGYYAQRTTTVIAGFKGSTAQTYANEFGLDFNQLTRYGDANLDGKVDVTDATLIQMHIAELVTLEGEALNNADVNDYGGVTIADVTIVQNVIAEVVDYITLFEPKG